MKVSSVMFDVKYAWLRSPHKGIGVIPGRPVASEDIDAFHNTFQAVYSSVNVAAYIYFFQISKLLSRSNCKKR